MRDESLPPVPRTGGNAAILAWLCGLPPTLDLRGGGMEESWPGDESFDDEEDFARIEMPDLSIKAADSADEAGRKFNQLTEVMKSVVKTANERGEKIQQLEKMTGDFKVEMRALQEKVATNHAPAGGPESELRQFVAKKGDKEVIRWVGGEDAEGIYRSGLLDDDIGTFGDWHQRAKDLFQQRSLVRVCLKSGDPNNQAGLGQSPKTDRLIEEHLKLAPPALQRIFSGASGAGSEWQQVTVLPMIAQELRHPLQVEALFDVVDMPTKTVQMPFDAGVARPYRKGTPTTNAPANLAASDNSTTSRTLTSDSLAVMILIFDDADEDAVIATRAFLSRKVVDGLRYGFEDCLINGDTGTHQDTLTGWNPRSIYNTGESAFGGTDDHRRSFIGLRALAFDASSSRDASADTSFSTQTLKNARLGLSAPHGVDGDLVYLASIEHYLNSILVDTNTLTLEKMGDKAAILTGQVASVLGARIVVSEFLTADLAASGLYTGTGSKTGGVLFNRKRYVVGNRRGVMLETAKDIRNGVFYMVATRRGTFKAVDASTHKACHYSYNL